jgi:hypothetical protein
MTLWPLPPAITLRDLGRLGREADVTHQVKPICHPSGEPRHVSDRQPTGVLFVSDQTSAKVFIHDANYETIEAWCRDRSVSG